MLIKFVRNAYNPRKRTYGYDQFNNRVFDFYADRVYSLPDDEARYYIQKGDAVIAEPVNRFREALKAIEANRPTTPPAEVSPLLKALGIIPNPQPKIRLPIQNKETLKALENKELIKNIKHYFSDKENISVKDIAEMLTSLFNYAVDIKDDTLIARVSADLQTLYRLTKIREKDDDK